MSPTENGPTSAIDKLGTPEFAETYWSLRREIGDPTPHDRNWRPWLSAHELRLLLDTLAALYEGIERLASKWEGDKLATVIDKEAAADLLRAVVPAVPGRVHVWGDQEQPRASTTLEGALRVLVDDADRKARTVIEHAMLASTTVAEAQASIELLLARLPASALPTPDFLEREPDGHTMAWFSSYGYQLGTATTNGVRNPGGNYRESAARHALVGEAVRRLDRAHEADLPREDSARDE